MSSTTIKEVLVHRRITSATKLLKVKIDDEVLETPFDPSDFSPGFSHEEVIEYYRRDGIDIIDWTSHNYFE